MKRETLEEIIGPSRVSVRLSMSNLSVGKKEKKTETSLDTKICFTVGISSDQNKWSSYSYYLCIYDSVSPSTAWLLLTYLHFVLSRGQPAGASRSHDWKYVLGNVYGDQSGRSKVRPEFTRTLFHSSVCLPVVLHLHPSPQRSSLATRFPSNHLHPYLVGAAWMWRHSPKWSYSMKQIIQFTVLCQCCGIRLKLADGGFFSPFIVCAEFSWIRLWWSFSHSLYMSFTAAITGKILSRVERQ